MNIHNKSIINVIGLFCCFLSVVSCNTVNESVGVESKIEYKVYNTCIDSIVLNKKLYADKVIILRDSTFNFMAGASKEARKIVSDSIAFILHTGQATLNKNDRLYIDKNQLHFNSKMYYYNDFFSKIDFSKLENETKLQYLWKVANQSYPNLKSIVSFSKISFTKNLEYALLQVREELSYSDSYSYLVYLKCIDGKWVILFKK